MTLIPGKHSVGLQEDERTTNLGFAIDTHTLGDGIGAEVAEAVKTIYKADNVPIEWEQVDVSGVETGDKHSEELFRESIASLKRNKLGLKGIYCLVRLGVKAKSLKVSCILLWSALVISHSTLHYDKN